MQWLWDFIPQFWVIEKFPCPFLKKEQCNDFQTLFLSTHLSINITEKTHFLNIKKWDNYVEDRKSHKNPQND